MTAGTCHIGPALAATPFQVANLTEEDAYAQFVRMRFSRWGGQPACEKCDCTAVWAYTSRRLYKCKMCEKQFSATSGTPWQRRKLSFKKLMYIVAAFSQTHQGKSARELCADLGVQYKTVFLWMHKIRNEINDRLKGLQLSGEVEIDGSYYGGHIRPRNQKKERKDNRRIFYKSSRRKMCVVAARERGGSIIPWIAQSEGAARPFISGALASDAVIFADQYPGWSAFRAQHQMFTINHKLAYYTAEACTNAVESFFNNLRMTEHVHGHISNRYLDLYAADTAWRLSRNGKAKDWGIRDIFAVMVREGKSALTGYFQGKRREMPVCQSDGSTSPWQPLSKADRIKDRAEVLNGEGVDSLGAARSPRENASALSNFEFVPAAEVIAQPELLPNGPGVYALFVRNGDDFLSAVGYEQLAHQPHWIKDDFVHLYTGESYGIRDRVLDHLVTGIDRSNFRLTLLAVAHCGIRMPGLGELTGVAEHDEAAFTTWLREHAVVGFKTCGYVKDAERAVLRATPSPINISGRETTEFSSLLRALRDTFKKEVGSAWPKSAPARKCRR